MYPFILLLCVITSQAAPSKDTVVTNLIVETATSASNRIDNSELATNKLIDQCNTTYTWSYRYFRQVIFSLRRRQWRRCRGMGVSVKRAINKTENPSVHASDRHANIPAVYVSIETGLARNESCVVTLLGRIGMFLKVYTCDYSYKCAKALV